MVPVDAAERWSVLAAAALLLALAILAAAAIAGQLGGASCALGTALPILPLRLDYAGFRLQAYGRSAASIPPGSTLCLALEWRPDLLAPGPVPAIRIELVGEGGQVVGRYVGPAVADVRRWRAGGVLEAQYAIPIAADAAEGRYLIVLSVLNNGGAPIPTRDGRLSLILGVLDVDRRAAASSSLLEGIVEGLHLKGHLRLWPFWPLLPQTDGREA